MDAVFVSVASASGVVAPAFLDGAFLAVEPEEAVVFAGAFFAPAADEDVFFAGAFEVVPVAVFVTEVLVVVFFVADEVVVFADEPVFLADAEREEADFVAGAFFLVDPEVVVEAFAVVELDFFADLEEAFAPAVEVVFFVEDVVEDAAVLAVDAFFAVVFAAVFVPVAVVFFSAVDTNTLSLSTGSPNISSTAVTI